MIEFTKTDQTVTRTKIQIKAYIVIFELLNLQTQFVDQYYEKIFTKSGGNHLKVHHMCQSQIFILGKCS